MILLDTSFLVAYFNLRDYNHQKAVKAIHDVVRKKFGTPYMTDYIFSETVTVALIKMKDLDRVTRIGNYMLKALETIRIEEDVFLDAWSLFRSQRGTRLGFTDCTTIAAMRYHKIGNIATFDEDFTKIDGITCVSL
jgi:predicted nucleic acid-binding protein